MIPEEWLHATVQGIHHAIDDSQTDKLRGTLHEELAGMQPFQVQLGPVWPGITAVTVAVYPEDGTAKLNGRVRAAMEKVPGIALRAPELRFWAHASLSYARQDFTDRKLNRALRALRPPRVDITIDRVHLVNQYQRPDLGYYTWDVAKRSNSAKTQGCCRSLGGRVWRIGRRRLRTSSSLRRSRAAR